MKFIESAQDRETVTVSPDDVYDQLHQTFLKRLREDRARLTELGVALARITADSTGVFDEIKWFSHRLRGDAALFRVFEVAKAAKALELAATSASLRRSDHVDPSLFLMIDVLADRLAKVVCDTHSAPQ